MKVQLLSRLTTFLSTSLLSGFRPHSCHPSLTIFFFFWPPFPPLKTNLNANKANLPCMSSHRKDIKKSKWEENLRNLVPWGIAYRHGGKMHKIIFGSNIVYYSNHSRIPLTKKIKLHNLVQGCTNFSLRNIHPLGLKREKKYCNAKKILFTMHVCSFPLWLVQPNRLLLQMKLTTSDCVYAFIWKFKKFKVSQKLAVQITPHPQGLVGKWSCSVI